MGHPVPETYSLPVLIWSIFGISLWLFSGFLVSHLPGKDFLRGFGSRLGCWALEITSFSHQGYKGKGQYDFMSSQFCGTRDWNCNMRVSFHRKFCNENPVFFAFLKCLRCYICSLPLCKVLRNLWQLWWIRHHTHVPLLLLALFLWNLTGWTKLKLFNFIPFASHRNL